MRAIAVTTIAAQDSIGVNRLIKLSEVCSAELVLIGDKKSPVWNKKRLPGNVHYFSVEDQNARWPKLSALIPLNHYGRKNLAYLWAVENGVDILFDTDDDNFSEIDIFSQTTDSFRTISTEKEWINVYAYFGQAKLWPRGLPLDEVMAPIVETTNQNAEPGWHCYQSIVDGDPDLDAIGRMLYPENHRFDNQPPLLLENGQFCPTNSQATLWKKELFPYLYLPVTAPFRMTDIWRGIVIGGYLSAEGLGIMFGKLGVKQLRNEHSLMSDFNDEIMGHLYNKWIKQASDDLWRIKKGQSEPSILKAIYEALIERNFLGVHEREVLDHFLSATCRSQ